MSKTEKHASPPTPPGESPRWKCHLDMYDNLQALRFPSAATFAKATQLLWTPALRELPFDIAGNYTIFVPAEAVPYFGQLKFEQSPVLTPADLPRDELEELRREQGPY